MNEQPAELSHADAMTRIIHLINSQGDVVAIGWEPATSIIDRRKAFAQTNEVISRVSQMLSMIHTRRIPPGSTYAGALTDILNSDEAHALVDAMADLRSLMPATARGTDRGMGFPFPADLSRFWRAA